MVVGILALQGCVEPHQKHLEALGAKIRSIRTVQDIEGVDAFILPGGESTTMLILLKRLGLWEPLIQALREKPAWGICAGAILMAEHVQNPAQDSFKLFPCTIERNAYGRQLSSRRLRLIGLEPSSFLTSEEATQIKEYDMYLIRAPRIQSVSACVQVLARHQGEPIWCVHGKHMLTTFHPELNKQIPSPIHAFFLHHLTKKLPFGSF